MHSNFMVFPFCDFSRLFVANSFALQGIDVRLDWCLVFAL